MGGVKTPQRERLLHVAPPITLSYREKKNNRFFQAKIAILTVIPIADLIHIVYLIF